MARTYRVGYASEERRWYIWLGFVPFWCGLRIENGGHFDRELMTSAAGRWLSRMAKVTSPLPGISSAARDFEIVPAELPRDEAGKLRFFRAPA